MAGDWIPITVNLPKRREVVAIAAETGRSRFEVTGLLVALWGWADGETSDGSLDSVPLLSLTEIIGADEKFWRAVVKAGWLVETEAGFTIPNFERWNGRNAKTRVAERDKKRRQRDTPEPVPNSVPKMSRSKRDKTGTTEQNRTGQKRTEERKDESPIGDSCPEPPDTATSGQSAGDVVLIFPCVGKQKTWGLVTSKVSEWAEAFPGVDVPHECRKALQWLRDNPTRQKTSAGMPRFLSSWLERCQNRTPAPRAGPPASRSGTSETVQNYLSKFGASRDAG